MSFASLHLVLHALVAAAVGLLIHMALDAADCRLGSGVWFV